jgi:phage tail-like protein
MPSSGERNDPFLAFRFEVRLDDLPPAGFSECTGLSLEIEVEDHFEGGLNAFVRKLPGRTKQSNLTLKRGIVDRKLWDWFYDLTQGKLRFRNATILVRDEAGAEAVMVWQLNRAFPTKWVGPDLNASQNNVAVETLELCFEGLERLT